MKYIGIYLKLLKKWQIKYSNIVNEIVLKFFKLEKYNKIIHKALNETIINYAIFTTQKLIIKIIMVKTLRFLFCRPIILGKWHSKDTPFNSLNPKNNVQNREILSIDIL